VPHVHFASVDKSSIHFAKGISMTIREEIKVQLDIQNAALSEKYLGMPTHVGISVNNAFKYLKERVWNKGQGWMKKALYAGEKEVLIKPVAQAMPTYSMSSFKLLRGLCQHINGVLHNFWWGSTRKAKGHVGLLGMT
jgi:hypothetical protein